MINRICIIGPCINLGGIERSSVTLANYLATCGLKVTYLAIFKRPHFFQLEEGIILDEPSHDSDLSGINFLKAVQRIRKRIKIIRPDAIFVFNKFYGAISTLALLGINIPIFVSERMSPLSKGSFKTRLINRISFWLKPPKGVIAQTIIAARFQRKYYPKRTPIEVIPNAIRKVIQHPEINRIKIILAVGRLNDRAKGFDRLLLAFSKTENPDWHLVFAGGDEEGDFLKILARELGIFERIRFLGKVKDVDQLYAQASIFVIPSRSEGFPNALCEAMAAGLACISYDFIAGARDIITHGQNGLIVENGNIQALANAITFLAKNQEERERLGKNALKIRETLSMEKIGQKYLEFIIKHSKI